MKYVEWAEGVKPLLTSIDRVKQHPDNPNNGDDENLIESIQINGFYTAITADADTGYILAGNTRYRSLLALGATEIPVIWTKKGAEGALRVLIGDNESARLAQMDKAAQLALLQDLAETEVGLAGTGFTDQSLELLAAQVALEAEQEIGAGQGFGAGEAPNGIFQVVVDFYSEDERDELFTRLSEEMDIAGTVRTANL